MTGHVNISGTWKDIDTIHAKVGGAWKEVTEGYTKVGGVWKQFLSPSAGVDETELGTPYGVYNQGDTIPYGGYAGPAFFAIDVQPFDATTSGIIFEMGATAVGAGITMVAGGELRAAAFDGDWNAETNEVSKIIADVSNYYGESGTFYFYANSGEGIKVWWVGATSGINLLGTGTVVSDNIWGTNAGAVGLDDTTRDFDVNTNNYTGTIDELRWWESGPPTALQ